MSTQLLIQTMQGMGTWLAELRSSLKTPTDRPCVYYICPLSNLRLIAGSGILPHDSAPHTRTDLSGQSVQARRDLLINLNGGKVANAHQCINLFWNPINWTLRAFQRNGLLREASSNKKDEAVVCILEIDLENLLKETRCEWTIAPKNLAGSGFTNYTSEYFTGDAVWDDGTPKCDWKHIFTTELTSDRALNGKRSAELIVYLGGGANGGNSVAVPFDFVARIIVPAADARVLTQEQIDFLRATGKTVTPLSKVGSTSIFFPKSELLKAENGFLTSIEQRLKSDPGVLDKINEALKVLETFEKDHLSLCPIRSNYLRDELADGHHGSLHAARVMFWCAFLAQDLDQSSKEGVMSVILIAASLHDTHRLGLGDEATHGQASVDANRAKVAAYFSLPAQLEACLNAIRYHSVPDDQCPDLNLALQILKDSDALERGRFGAPDKEKGCDTKFFRTNTLKLGDPYKNIAWIAFWTASITRYSPVGSTPCTDFSTSLCAAVNSLAKE